MRFGSSIALVLWAWLTACNAMAADWTATAVRQPVNYTVDKVTWKRLETGTTVPSGAWVSTGPRGRVVLQHGQDMITLKPGTMSAIFAKAASDDTFEVAQQRGEISVEF